MKLDEIKSFWRIKKEEKYYKEGLIFCGK